MKSIARLVTFLCFSWLLFYVLCGSTSALKAFFAEVAGLFFKDKKGGTAMITMAIPVLLSGTVCSSLLLRQPEAPGTRRTTLALPHQLPGALQRWIYASPIYRTALGEGNLDHTAIAFIVVPAIVYVLTSIDRHFRGKDLSTDNKVMHVGNSFGIAALIAMSVFLIPIARHSSLVNLMGWSAASAVRLHTWSGRIVVLGSVIHGSMHMFRWSGLAGEGLISMLIPPGECWTMSSDNDFMPTCVHSSTGCSCYHHFRNFTGLVATTAMVLIAITSLNSVRRRFYTLFYRVHVIAGPMVLFFTILHWNRAMLYMASSILYYVASSFPVLFESFSKRRRGGGVQIVATEEISEPGMGDNPRTCVSITVQASDIAMQRYRAGSYVQLLAPDISGVSHPFSVNTVVGHNNRIQIIFRVTGNYTRKLAGRLANPQGTPPNLYMDGYYGSPDRLAQVLSHDVVSLVAGGIGITPYLSLLNKARSKLSTQGHMFPTKRITLHWICRDACLIEYIMSEHFEPLLQLPKEAGFQIRIIVHRTGMVARETKRVFPPVSDVENSSDDNHFLTTERTKQVSFESSEGTPFTPSRFVPGSKASYVGNLPSVLSFATVAWIGLVGVWHFYSNVQSPHEVATRMWSPIFVVILGISIAAAVNVSFRYGWDDNDGPVSAGWTAVKRDHDDGNESLELRDLSHAAAEDDKGVDGLQLDGGSTASLRSTVVLEEKEGRPTVHHLLNSLDDAKQPGLFACGPEALMQELRKTTEERCMVRCRQCITGDSHIALYEEAFAM